MPAHRLSMHKIRDVLRMHFQLQLSHRQIARALSLSRAGVRVTIERAKAAGLTWPLPGTKTDAELELRLYPPAEPGSARPRRPEPEWEKAAAWYDRSQTKRMYPWGDSPPAPALANLDGSFGGTIDVRALPHGDSAVGCRQMIGNVWEWTDSML